MKEKILKIIVSFFIVMLCCSLIARGADSITVAKVKTGHLKKGDLTEKFEGSGGIAAKNREFLFMPEGQKVAQILVKAGAEVEAGQAIIQLDMEYLEELIKEQERQVEKTRLQMEQQKLEGKGEARTPATAQAEITLNGAADTLRNAQEKYQMAVDEYNAYVSNPPVLDEEEQQEFDLKVQTLQDQIEAAADNMKAADSAYDQALESYHLAEQEEANNRANEAARGESNDLSLQGLQVDLDGLNDKLQKLMGIKDEGGVVTSQSKGIVESIAVTEGAITTGSEQIVLANEELESYGNIPEDKIGKIAVGDEVEILISGNSKPIPVDVERIELDEKGKTSWFAPVEKGKYQIGTNLTYDFNKKSESSYEQIIPLSALRESNGNSYVLTAEVRPGILGESYEAVRVPVMVLNKDESNAAVETSLSYEALIITETNKYVEEGDRVRLSE